MDSVIYHIPARLIDEYRGHRVVVRSGDPAELVRSLSGADAENVLYVRLLSPRAEVDVLARWETPVAVDISMQDPAREFPLLYNFSRLLDRHRVRVSVPVRPGFVKAVRLALALNFAVKLEVGQPAPELVEEMGEVLQLYLHRPNVARPVEYFHSLFLYFFGQEPTDLWFVQEEDPELFRFVTDEGEETVPPRLAGVDLEKFSRAPLNAKSECDLCEYLECCGGYFKWPDKEFGCEGVKQLFGTLKEAAEELRRDLDAYSPAQGGVRA